MSSLPYFIREPRWKRSKPGQYWLDGCNTSVVSAAVARELGAPWLVKILRDERLAAARWLALAPHHDSPYLTAYPARTKAEAQRRALRAERAYRKWVDA